MRSLLHPLFAIIVNILGLIAANFFIAGFNLAKDPMDVFWVALLFTILNSFVKPFLKLILAPLIVLSLGLGLIVINMGMLLFLDKLSQNLNIVGVSALIFGSLILGGVNFIFHFSTTRE